MEQSLEELLYFQPFLPTNVTSLSFKHVFFLSEMTIVLMKMHSYFATNMEYHTNHIAVDDNSTSVRYPKNITLLNFIDFLLVPTLCYELDGYPRTSKIRISYLVEKFAAFIGIWSCLHVLVFAYIMPVLTEVSRVSTWYAISHLIFPFMLGYLMIFYIVFDVICNGFAELTKFADREFYSDWWNSTTFDEFARKWNKPVHEWLLRHVYLESIKSYKVSTPNASVITFLFSSIVHEYFMSVALKVYRPWLFIFQMTQLPLIFIGRHPLIKGQRLGNFIFWIGMLIGPPLLSVLYCREFFLQQTVLQE